MVEVADYLIYIYSAVAMVAGGSCKKPFHAYASQAVLSVRAQCT